MYELELIKAGLYVGYFVCLFAFCIGTLIGYIILVSRYEKFLRENKMYQKFKDWEHNNKKVLKYVKQ